MSLIRLTVDVWIDPVYITAIRAYDRTPDGGFGPRLIIDTLTGGHFDSCCVIFPDNESRDNAATAITFAYDFPKPKPV